MAVPPNRSRRERSKPVSTASNRLILHSPPWDPNQSLSKNKIMMSMVVCFDAIFSFVCKSGAQQQANHPNKRNHIQCLKTILSCYFHHSGEILQGLAILWSDPNYTPPSPLAGDPSPTFWYFGSTVGTWDISPSPLPLSMAWYPWTLPLGENGDRGERRGGGGRLTHCKRVLPPLRGIP